MVQLEVHNGFRTSQSLRSSRRFQRSASHQQDKLPGYSRSEDCPVASVWPRGHFFRDSYEGQAGSDRLHRLLPDQLPYQRWRTATCVSSNWSDSSVHPSSSFRLLPQPARSPMPPGTSHVPDVAVVVSRRSAGSADSVFSVVHLRGEASQSPAASELPNSRVQSRRGAPHCLLGARVHLASVWC